MRFQTKQFFFHFAMRPLKEAIQEFNKRISPTFGANRLIKDSEYAIIYGDAVRTKENYLEDNKDKIPGSEHYFAWYTMAFLDALFPKLEFPTFESCSVGEMPQKILTRLYRYVSRSTIPEGWRLEFAQIIAGESLESWKERYVSVNSESNWICFYRINLEWREYESVEDMENDTRVREGQEYADDVFALDNSLKFFVPLRRRIEL